MPRPRSLLALALIFAGAAPLAACNALTGADDLAVDDALGKKKHHGTTDDTSTAATSGAGGSDATSSGAGAADPTTTTGTGTLQGDGLTDARGVSISEVAIYQGVKRELMQNGAEAQTSIPVVAGRDALVRVFVSIGGDYDGSPVTARLSIDGQAPIETTATVGGVPSDGQLGSTVNFQVPGAAIQPGSSYKIELRQPPTNGEVDNPAASWPSEGTVPLEAESSGPQLIVQLVPVAYGADGSNRLPNTSSGQIEAYRKLFLGIYPVPAVDIQVHAAVTWNSGVYADGTGWDSLLDGIAQLREQDGAPKDVYYYGIFSPDSSFGNFCGGGCVAGLGMIGGPADSYSRAAIGLGFGGDVSTETAVHEIGHTHGRQHAPCGGPAGVDGSYPYDGAKIGVWGYDITTGQLMSPSGYVDMMSYCQPTWVSDYTFKALFARAKYVNGASMVFPPEMLNKTWQRVRIDAQGNATWMAPMQLRTPPLASASRDVVFQTQSGPEGAKAQFYPYDHLEGGVLFLPDASAAWDTVQIDVGGKTVTLNK